MKTRVTVNEVKQKIEKTGGDKVEVLLKANHIFKSFMSNTVLNDISIELHSGECLALIGENGAGKSTLMKILTGIYKWTEERSKSGESRYRYRALSMPRGRNCHYPSGIESDSQSFCGAEYFPWEREREEGACG